MAKASGAAVELFESLPPSPRVFSVSEITRSVRVSLEKAIGEVWVQGEVCNHRKQSSGHQYFGLKDERALLACVLFQKQALRLPALSDGMLVQVRGDLTVYEARGQYQLIVNLVQSTGVGLLQAKFEALKRRLEAEGLFAPERKRALPKYPAVIGIVTSPTGAAIHDMLNILQRRAGWVRVVINPVRVQGTGAAAEIAAALRWFGESNFLPRPEVIVLCRGGGSAEDLWEFNEEILARAIFASSIPVVSAVGHEIDFTIADFVADLRAPTPSAAAELIVPDGAELRAMFAQRRNRMQREVANCLTKWKANVVSLGRAAVFREPRKRLLDWAQWLDSLEDRLRESAAEAIRARRQRAAASLAVLRQHRPDQIWRLKRQQVAAGGLRMAQLALDRIEKRRHQLQRLESMLRVLSPDGTMSRGYSITMDAEGKIIRSAKAVAPRAELTTQFRDGSVKSVAK